MTANDGVASAFTDSGQAVLALIHLFRGTVDVGALLSLDQQQCGADGRDVSPAPPGDGTRLLDRAAELGLLIRFDDGYYGVLPGQRDWFSTLFERHVTSFSISNRDRAEAVYANVFAQRGRRYDQQIDADGQAALHGLRRDEENLLHALHLARAQHDRDAAAGCLRGLYHLYRLTGKDLQWSHITSMHRDHIDRSTGQPDPARIEDHRLIIACYLDLAQACLAQSDPEWLTRCGEAFDLSGLIGDVSLQADVANCIGNVYLTDARERDLDRAEGWIMHAFELIPAADDARRAVSYGFIGNIAFDRFLAATQERAGQDLIGELFHRAAEAYLRALTMLPADDHHNRAFFHTEYGNLISQIWEWDTALEHHRLAVGHFEALGDQDSAERARLNVARTLAQAGRAGAEA